MLAEQASLFSIRLIFDGKDDTNHDPIAQSSVSYSFSNDDRQKVSADWMREASLQSAERH